MQNWKTSLPALDEGSQEAIPLPGLAELKGHWQGRFDASGGGNGDTSVCPFFSPAFLSDLMLSVLICFLILK